MGIIVTTPPAELPVTVEEFMEHARIDDGHETNLVEGLLTAATQQVEADCDVRLVETEYNWTLDAFPLSPWCPLRPYHPPLLSVEEIRYVDPAGDEQVWDDDEYIVDVSQRPGRILPAFERQWPQVRCQPGAVTIRYTAGFGGRVDVPQIYKQAVLLLASHWHEQREPVVTGTTATALPLSYQTLINAGRIPQVA